MNKEDGYHVFIEVSPYPTLIQLKHSLRGIHHCVTVVGEWIFDSHFPFALPLTTDNLNYCCINYNETKGMNRYKVVLKAIMFSPK